MPSEIVADPAVVTRRSLPALYLELTKARLSLLVLLTTAVGYVLGAGAGFGSGFGGGIDWSVLLWTMVGTALAAGAANALNQVVEFRRDALMHRTRNRPLPSGALGLVHGLAVALVMGYAGVFILAALVNLAAAGLALLTIVVYVGVYTPLKCRSTVNTLVGAMCGAIPPVIGWVAASGSLGPGAWALAALLFVWQIPHFLALAWIYREDYARGGFAMLPVFDRGGQLTCQMVVLGSLMLLPVGLIATLAGPSGWIYVGGSMILGLWLVGLGIRLYARRTDGNARSVFRASVVYLPVLLCLLVLDRPPLGGASIGPLAQASAAQPYAGEATLAEGPDGQVPSLIVLAADRRRD